MKVTNLKVAEDRRAWRKIIEKAKIFTFEIVVKMKMICCPLEVRYT